MGAVVTAPLGFLSSCAGGCLAAGCCKLATAGSTDTNKGARCVLFWLQVVAVVLAALMSWNPKAWLDWPCDKLPDLGICECSGLNDETSCYTDQLIYRTEASVLVVFLLLLIMCVSGCARQAAQSCPVGKFLILILLVVITLFIPNASMTFFGNLAGVLSAIYLVAQMVIVIDFGYTWNDVWYAKSRQRLMEQPGGAAMLRTADRGHGPGLPATPWTYGIMISSALLFLAALVVAIILCVNFNAGGAIAIVIVTFVVTLVLLYISITEWCEVGNLLASCVVLLYSMWLAYEALAVMPETSMKLLPWWFSLVICAASLVAFAYGTSSKATPEEGQARDLETTLPTGEAEGENAAEQDDVPEGMNTGDFTKQCLIHASAAVYIASCWAPSRNGGNFAARVIALVLSLAMYGWTLIAPKVLKNRQF